MPRAAVVQMISTPNVQENLNELSRYFRTAREEGAQLLVLPENFACMALAEEDKWKVAEKWGHGLIQHTLSHLAKQYGLWVVAGAMFLQTSKKRLKASSLVYDEKGSCVARYDKIHLFDVRVSADDVYQESSLADRGDEVVVVDTPIGRVGLSICYDVRFPELYRQLVIQGAELITVPAAFTAVTGQAHWAVLLRARAIENLCYVLAANQGGTHENGRKTYGHSMIIEPWGNILCEHQTGTGIEMADIDLIKLRALREQFPCNDHHVLMTDKVNMKV